MQDMLVTQAMNILVNEGCDNYVFSHTFNVTKVYTESGTWEYEEDQSDQGNLSEKTMKSSNDGITLIAPSRYQMSKR